MENKKALIVASVASMIDQFNIPNIKLLQELGYEVHVACNFINGGTIPAERTKKLISKLNAMNVKYYHIDFDRNPFKLIKMYKSYKQMKSILKNNYDLVHSHSPVGGVVARIAANKYRGEGLTSIYTAHGFHFYKGAPIIRWLTFYPIEKILSRMTDILITINKEDYNVSKKNNFKASNIIYIPGVGIDTDKFKKRLDKNKNHLRKELKIEETNKIICYVGELNKNKNQSLLIDVIYLLKEEFPNIKLLLVGDGSEKNRLQMKVKRLNLCNNVIILGFRTDINEILSNTNIYVAPSKREGLPVNVLEAMSMGLPIIASNNRGHRDLIKNDKNGYIVRSNLPSEYVFFIKKIINDINLQKSFCKRNLEMVDKFSVKNINKELKKCYNNI